MRATHNALRSTLLILTVVLIAGGGCSQSGDKAALEGFSSVDLVGGSESIAPDGQNDALISLRVGTGGTGGTITTLTVHNVGGQPGTRDTIPANSLWVLGVADKEKPRVLLNRSDSSIEIKVDKAKELLLYFADNGAVRDGKTGLSVTATYADGTRKEIAVQR